MAIYQNAQCLIERWQWRLWAGEDFLDRGYIDLEGQFWPVTVDTMETALRACFADAAKSSEDGKYGWIVVTANEMEGDNIYWRKKRESLNAAQRETLVKIGLNPDDQTQPRNKAIKYEDIFPADHSHLHMPISKVEMA